MKKKIIKFGSIALLIGAILTYLLTYDKNSFVSNVGLISLLLGTIGSIASIYIPNSYTQIVNQKDWIQINNEYQFLIFYKKHGIKEPKAICYQKTENGYEEVVIDFSFENNNVLAKVGLRIDAKIIIH